VFENMPSDHRVETAVGERRIDEVAVEHAKAKMRSRMLRRSRRQLDSGYIPAAFARQRERVAVRGAELQQGSARRTPALQVDDAGDVSMTRGSVALEWNGVPAIVIIGQLRGARDRRHELEAAAAATKHGVAALHEACFACVPPQTRQLTAWTDGNASVSMAIRTRASFSRARLFELYRLMIPGTSGSV
jgi:hypothetical protein